MVLDPLNTAWAQICLLHLVTERGSAEVKHFLPSLGKHGVERRGSGTNTWIYSAEGPFGCLLTCPPLVCSTYPSYPSTHHGSCGQQGSSPFHPPRGAAGLCHQLCSPLQFQQISKLLRDQESKPCCTDQHNKIGLIPALEKQNRLLDDCTQEDFFLSARSVPLLGILLPKFCL